MRVFPSRTRSTYAVVWRVESPARSTSQRLAWGLLPIPDAEIGRYGIVEIIEAVLADLRDHGHVPPLPEGEPGAPGGGGGRPDAGQNLDTVGGDR